MPRTKPKAKPLRTKPVAAAKRATSEEVLTLAETAAYLRLPEAEVLRMVREQGLPGRQLGGEWRFLQAALRDWLRTPSHKPSKEAVLASIGSWKHDPYLDQLLQEIDKQRGRSVTEDGR